MKLQGYPHLPPPSSTNPLVSWQELLQITQDRKALLAGAAEVHNFIREADDTKDRITDKVCKKGSMGMVCM